MLLALVLEDSDAWASVAKAVLKKHGFDVVVVDSLVVARTLIALRRFDLVLIDINIATGQGVKSTQNGMSLADTLRATSPLSRVIMWSESSGHFDAAKSVGAAYVTKTKKPTGDITAARLGDALRTGANPI